MTVFSRLLPTISFIYAVQLGAAAVFVPLKTERFYDFFGSLGFISAGAFSLYNLGPWAQARIQGQQVPLRIPPLSAHAPRQLLITGCMMLWAGRLGYFLFRRVVREGHDSRFDDVRANAPKFAFFWFAQATWVTLVSLPVLLINSVPAAAHKPLGPRDFLGLALFASSFAFEIVADNQKSAWKAAKKEKKHEEEFITSGLWSLSRHPNYVGEVGIQSGLALLSTGAFGSPGFGASVAALALVSPIFTYFLLSKVSGVPPLEEQGEKRYGSNPKWQEYKKTTPVFFPWAKP